MNQTIDTILDDCLAQLRAGSSVEACLARYPEQADDLRSLLAVAVQVQGLSVPPPDRAAMNAGRQRMIEAVRARAARQEQAGLLGLAWLRWPSAFSTGPLSRPLVRAAATVALALLIVALSVGGLVAAAQGSLPGEPLYSLKRTAETVRMALTLDPAAQQQLQSQLDHERQREVRAVLASGRTTTLEFKGILEHLETGYWIVSGLKVVLDEQSVIEGQPILGAIVSLRAEALSDGTLRAIRLQVESSFLLPSPTPTRTPSPTPPPATASATTTRAETPQPTASPSPTSTLTPTRRATPLPSATATLTSTPRPQLTDPPPPTATREPESTDHPEPGETEEPESTDQPEPGETEEPESTDQPEPGETEEPESTHQPTPSATDDDDDSEHSGPPETGTPQPTPNTTATEESGSSGQSGALSPGWTGPAPAAATGPYHFIPPPSAASTSPGPSAHVS